MRAYHRYGIFPLILGPATRDQLVSSVRIAGPHIFMIVFLGASGDMNFSATGPRFYIFAITILQDSLELQKLQELHHVAIDKLAKKSPEVVTARGPLNKSKGWNTSIIIR